MKYLNPKKNIDIYFIERRAVCPPAQHIRKCLSAANSKTFHSAPFSLFEREKKNGEERYPSMAQIDAFSNLFYADTSNALGLDFLFLTFFFCWCLPDASHCADAVHV